MTEKNHKKSDLLIYEFTVTKATLMAVDERERMFFILLGLACNEIMILQKIVLAIDLFNKDTENLEKRAHIVQGGFITRLLIAKMFEAWEKIFRQLLFNSPFRRDYEEHFSSEVKGALEDLGRFYGQNGYIANLRNDYIFHYPSDKLNAAIPNIPDADDWKIYLSKTDGNSLYYLSEMIAGHAMIAEVNPDKAVGCEKIIEDRNFVARRIIALSTGCMNVFVERHLGLSIDDGTPITIKVTDLFDVTLPFFTGEASEKKSV